MSLERRLEKLEKAAGQDHQEPIVIVFVSPDTGEEWGHIKMERSKGK